MRGANGSVKGGIASSAVKETQKSGLMMKKKIKKTKKLSQAQLLKKYEKIMKPIILSRDGHRCQIAGYRHTCSDMLVMDHRPAKRGKHSTFFYPPNLTTTCATANFLAEHDPFINHAILEALMRREGHVLKEIEERSKIIKKWYEDEIVAWIDKCREYFKTNKTGSPDKEQK